MTIISRGGAETWWGRKLPDGVAYMYKDHHYHDWVSVTYKEILKKKTDRQMELLRRKRLCSKMVPGFIHVFYNNTTFFAGWWIYVITVKKEYRINFRHDNNPFLVRKAMELFPCGTIPILENFDHWSLQFSKAYAHQGLGRKKKQGLARCWCQLDEYGELKDISMINKPIPAGE